MSELPADILPPPRPRTRPVAVRFDEFTLRRMKALATKRHKGYQTLLKEFVSERLYEEERRETEQSGGSNPGAKPSSRPAHESIPMSTASQRVQATAGNVIVTVAAAPGAS